jgi:hypothetical protein
MVVAAVAAIVSYAHMQHLAELHGEAWRSVLIPLAVDGMLVASTLAVVSQRRHRRPGGWVPWLGLALGIVASLAANVAAARPEVIAQLIAAWPPVALAVSIETLVVVLRSDMRRPDQVRPEGLVEPATAVGFNGTCSSAQPDAGETCSADPVTELIESGAGRRRLATELGITEHQARVMLEARRNGAGDVQT